MNASLLLRCAVLGLVFVGCSAPKPVPVSQCKAVVKHAQKVLGDMAPKDSEMMAKCKKATDAQRGCIMAAEKKLAVTQCQ